MLRSKVGNTPGTPTLHAHTAPHVGPRAAVRRTPQTNETGTIEATHDGQETHADQGLPLIARPDNVGKKGWNLYRAMGFDPEEERDKKEYAKIQVSTQGGPHVDVICISDDFLQAGIRDLVATLFDLNKPYTMQLNKGHLCQRV